VDYLGSLDPASGCAGEKKKKKEKRTGAVLQLTRVLAPTSMTRISKNAMYYKI
jgi:hypothetical protein